MEMYRHARRLPIGVRTRAAAVAVGALVGAAIWTTPAAAGDVCAPGTYLNPGDGTCVLAPAGTYAGAYASTPTPCPAGTYNPNPGAASKAACVPCPEGSYSADP